jgi:hypothetical protein
MRFDRRRDPIDAALTQEGMSLRALSSLSPVLLVFPKPLGTSSCRAWLSALAAARREIESRGVRPAVVHEASEGEARAELSRFGLEYIARVADPDGALHDRFGLSAGTAEGRPPLRDWLARRRGRIRGDASRAAGLVLLLGGEVRAERRSAQGSDLPALLEIAGAAPPRP